MKKHRHIAFAVLFSLFGFATACSDSDGDDNPTPGPGPGPDPGTETTITIEPTLDATSLIRNPLSGWVLYDDANDNVQQATNFWPTVDAFGAKKYASIFYWRSRWSELEPQEGQYAWVHDENFKAMIQGALDRGMKVAFRVYYDGQDNIASATPDFVKAAGAKGYNVSKLWGAAGNKDNWTPYADDPIFLAKLENFIKAFAKEFDDPTRVDFVDGYNLGWWGEGHNVKYLNSSTANQLAVYKKIIGFYSNNFKKVLLATPFGTAMGWSTEKQVAVNENGYIIRRDGLGSEWFQSTQVNQIMEVFPKTAFIGESCYWGADDYKPWTSDNVYKNVFKSWVDVYKQNYADIIKGRGNLLDLREAQEFRRLSTQSSDILQNFIENGGYRLAPVKVIVDKDLTSTGNIVVKHTWRNSAYGVCPNNNVRWNYKYKVAFTLTDAAGAIKQLIIDTKSDPSEWLKDNDKTYDLSAKIDVPAGTYTLKVGIIDTSLDNKPGLNMAVKDADAQGWLKLTDLTIK